MKREMEVLTEQCVHPDRTINSFFRGCLSAVARLAR